MLVIVFKPLATMNFIVWTDFNWNYFINQNHGLVCFPFGYIYIPFAHVDVVVSVAFECCEDVEMIENVVSYLLTCHNQPILGLYRSYATYISTMLGQ